VAVLLAMVLAGAGGDTAEAMADVLHLESSRDVRLGGLLGQLASTDDVTVSVANALWAQPDVPFGGWSTRFDRSDTIDAPFALAGGEQVRVPMMRRDDSQFGYVERPGYRMLRLPYGDTGRFGMEVLLPDRHSDLAALLRRLDADEWREATEALAERTVTELALPQFELQWQAELNEPLTALGMGGAFNPAADFRPMSPLDPWLGTVVHKTYLRVDEDGTEAAAVTGGEMVVSGPARLEFRVDRPFAFTISDRETGTILFLGAVADPR
jgi:serine protease inhibitor